MAPVAQKMVATKTIRKLLKEHDLATREIKKFTDTFTLTAVSTGSITQLTGNIAQGNNINNRSGDQIKLHKFEFSQTLTSGLASAEYIRVIFFMDHWNDGTTPVVADVLNASTVTSFQNFANEQSKRFKILSDLVFHSDAVGTGVTHASKQTHKLGTVVNYLGSGLTNGHNQIFMLLVSTLAASGASVVTDYNVRYMDA